MSVPVGEALIGRVVNALGQPIDGKGPIADHAVQPGGAAGARRGGAAAGEGAAADRHQGHRLHDSHRPRPARADHRRPPDRQDGHRARHHHQPEGRRHDLHLRRHRPEALHGGAGGEDAGRLRRHGIHHRGGGHGLRSGADAVHRAVRRLRHGRVFPRQRQARPVHLRRSFQARRGLPRNLAAAAPAARPRSLSRRRVLPAQPAAGARRQVERRRTAAGRSPRCRSSKPRRATFPPTSPPTSSRSPTARSSSKPTCSTPTCGRPSTSASR